MALGRVLALVLVSVSVLALLLLLLLVLGLMLVSLGSWRSGVTSATRVEAASARR